uniref:GG17408 n=1 Tax=Drosophila erecta TaxID=7220 RepID=B3P1W1_DROER
MHNGNNHSNNYSNNYSNNNMSRRRVIYAINGQWGSELGLVGGLSGGGLYFNRLANDK